jgi:UDP-N-acetylmuramyl tripeptide synthase
VASGDRAAELGLRLAYGGLPAERLEVVPDLETALDHALELTDAGDALVVLPTYTAMLALRGVLTARGLVEAYWETPRP